MCNDNIQSRCDFMRFAPATNLVATATEHVTKDADSIIIGIPASKEAPPCSSFIQWGDCCCSGSDFELAYYTSVEGVYSTGPSSYTLIGYKLRGLIRGLSQTECNLTGDSSRAKRHDRNSVIHIGTTNIHYFTCLMGNALCQHISDSTTIYSSLGDLQTRKTPTGSGDLGIVLEGGSYRLYLDGTINNVPMWIGQTSAIPLANSTTPGLVSTKCPIAPATTPSVYNVGCVPLDTWYDNTTVCSPKVLATANLASVYALGSYALRKIVNALTTPSVILTAISAETEVATYDIVTETDSNLLLRVDLSSLLDVTLGTPNVSYRLDVKDSSNTIIHTETIVDRNFYSYNFETEISSLAPDTYTVSVTLIGDDANLSTVAIEKVKLDYNINPIC